MLLMLLWKINNMLYQCLTFAALTKSELYMELAVHVAPEDDKATFSQATPSAIHG